MAVWQAVVLGIVQGVTEFLPISSSAHLVFIPKILGMAPPPLAFDVLLHLGTLLAVVGYFARDLLRLLTEAWSGRGTGRRLLWWLILGSLPAALFGLLAHDRIEQAFAAPAATAWQLAFTGVLLFWADRRAGRRGLEELGPADALFIGIGQALAIIPGISRSGTTVAFGVWRGLDRREAARFSFLLSVPAILGAGLVEARSLWGATGGSGTGPAYLFGFLAALAAGALGIAFFLRQLSRGRLRPFAFYCWAAAAVFLLYLALLD